MREPREAAPELAAGHTLWLDAQAAAWGWFLDPTPWDDSAFTSVAVSLGEGESVSRSETATFKRMDLLTVLEHEIGHLLGQEHEADGLLAEPVPAGPRRVPSSDSDRVDVPALDPVFADGKTSLAAPFAVESILPVLLNGARQREGKA